MNIQIGDRIKFQVRTSNGEHIVWRTVNGFTDDDKPTVRFQGWLRFIVHRHEVIEHQGTITPSKLSAMNV